MILVQQAAAAASNVIFLRCILVSFLFFIACPRGITFAWFCYVGWRTCVFGGAFCTRFFSRVICCIGTTANLLPLAMKFERGGTPFPFFLWAFNLYVPTFAFSTDVTFLVAYPSCLLAVFFFRSLVLFYLRIICGAFVSLLWLF